MQVERRSGVLTQLFGIPKYCSIFDAIEVKKIDPCLIELTDAI
jgi:hypothetical protein